ncbi:MAG TPA: PEP/pyruvate-binding domain-containing protein, partial [Chloroflexota bacterium]|nr:PEP/pyruvate-binding domain-containing protein [Chloroflexota bacterium]
MTKRDTIVAASRFPPPGAGSPIVVALESLGRDDLLLAGGKAANLGELLRAGLPVPPGFCLTTAAYARMAGGADLRPLLDDLAEIGSGEPERLAAIAGAIRQRLLAAPMPDDVALSIREAVTALGLSLPLAVRSSATAEDLPFASFAGQQDTFLNIVGDAALLEAVRRCWASLWTERAVVYRARNGVDQRTVRLAVIVQRLVDAAVAGVLFTANPVTGRRDQVVIDASPGLGEAVVSGAVNPDHFVINASSGEILERRLGDKRVTIRPAPEGGVRRVDTAAAGPAACLSDEQLRDLAALGRRVE